MTDNTWYHHGLFIQFDSIANLFLINNWIWKGSTCFLSWEKATHIEPNMLSWTLKSESWWCWHPRGSFWMTLNNSVWGKNDIKKRPYFDIYIISIHFFIMKSNMVILASSLRQNWEYSKGVTPKIPDYWIRISLFYWHSHSKGTI